MSEDARGWLRTHSPSDVGPPNQLGDNNEKNEKKAYPKKRDSKTRPKPLWMGWTRNREPCTSLALASVGATEKLLGWPTSLAPVLSPLRLCYPLVLHQLRLWYRNRF